MLKIFYIKKPEGFDGFDEQLHFLSLQTEYHHPGVRTGAKWRCLWIFAGGAFKKYEHMNPLVS